MLRPRLVFAMLLCLTAPVSAQRPPALSAGDALRRISEHARAARSDAVLVMQGDEVLLEEYAGGTAGAPIEMMSATKSVVALAVVKLVGDGRIAGFEVPVHTWYPEWRQGRKRDITLRMLLNHTSGLQNEPNTSIEIYPAPDFVQLALTAELVTDPGSRYAYNNKATNLVAGIVERASGQKLDEYLGEHLFAPLEVQPGPWTRDSVGNPHAMSGLPLTARDAARIGQLVLQEGSWNGTRLLEPGLVRAMLGPGSDASDDVGLLWVRKPAYVRYQVDARSFALLEEIGLAAALIERVRTLAGRSFASQPELRAALLPALGDDGLQAWAETMIRSGTSAAQVFNGEKGPIVAYQAVGYLGQYIVIVPEAHMVAVRQFAWRQDVRDADSYGEFPDDVLALASALSTGGR